jgi:hypothetical protein
MAILLLYGAPNPGYTQDAPIPLSTATTLKKAITEAETKKLGEDIDAGLLAVFPPDGLSGLQFRGRTTVIASGDRYAVSLPSLSIIKPGLGIRVDVGSITLAARLLVDATLERDLRYDVTIRLPGMMPIVDAVTGEEISRIKIGSHNITGTWEATPRFFSAFKTTIDDIAWEQQRPPDPTDPDFNNPDYKPKPRQFFSANKITIESSLGINTENHLSGPVKLNFKDFRLFDQQTGTSIFLAKNFDWFVEGRKVDFTQYYNLIERFDRLITTGFKGYKQNGEQIDEDLRDKFFNDMTAEMTAIKPLFDGFDNVITLADASFTLPNSLGEISSKGFTFGVVMNGFRDGMSQLGFRLIATTARLTPAMKRPDLFPKDMDIRLSVNNIPNKILWPIILSTPENMKQYGEMAGLDYTWNNFFYNAALYRTKFEFDKSFVRSRDLDIEFVANGSIVPNASYMIAGAANVNLIGIDELSEKIRRVARDMNPQSEFEEEERRKLNDLAKNFASLRDSGDRGLQREKGMTRRYNVVIEPDGSIQFNGTDAVNLFFPKKEGPPKP